MYFFHRFFWIQPDLSRFTLTPEQGGTVRYLEGDGLDCIIDRRRHIGLCQSGVLIVGIWLGLEWLEEGRWDFIGVHRGSSRNVLGRDSDVRLHAFLGERM